MCGGPHYQCDCPESQSRFVHREGKAPMGRGSSSHHIFPAINNRRGEHQSMVVDLLGTLIMSMLKFYLIMVIHIVLFHLVH
jgi:hypothetical protein